MKRFVITAFIFLSLILAACLFLHYYIIPKLGFTPYYWGDKLITEKRNAAVASSGFNTLFFGSSMVYRQINPAAFDSVVNKNSNLDIKSFNFGVNWLASSELIYLTDNILNDIPEKPRYVFLELQRIKMVNYKNYLTTRIIYWYTPELYKFTVDAILHSRMPFYSKAGQFISHTVNFIGNQINLGYFTEALRFLAETHTAGLYRTPEEVGNGFLSLEAENKKLLESGVNPERLNRFLKDTATVYARKQASITAFSYFEKHPEDLSVYNTAYAAKLNSMIEKYKVNNIHLIIFLPPRLDRLQYQELLPVLNALPDDHRLNMADARLYPGFYLASHSFDVTHMNEKGAALYSRNLAEQFVNRMIKMN
ncbi:MAG: hypothetical protein JNL47_09775 [Bacteroidia bacterium]|nr:hypothetical protein [Bacteroidia bacterium]